MGLDITAYKNLTLAKGNEAFDETGEIKDEDGWFQLYVNPSFPGRASDIEDDHAYKAEDCDSMRAGSYGGYNWWREQLAKLAGYPETEYEEEYIGAKKCFAAGAWEESKGDFWELILFSDCEGTIGTEISKKLAKDFARFQDKADLHDNDLFKNKYSEWRKMFETASENGAVQFR